MSEEFSMDQVFLKQLNAVIEAHLEDEQFSVEELAMELGLSRSQLHRKLNAINGKSTSQYIREYRLGKAMELLQSNIGFFYKKKQPVKFSFF
jgi:AraC-like DNA-binding protein